VGRNPHSAVGPELTRGCETYSAVTIGDHGDLILQLQGQAPYFARENKNVNDYDKVSAAQPG